MRHGKTVYGKALVTTLKRIGQEPETFPQMPAMDPSIVDPMEQLEGRLSDEGAAGLRASVEQLAKMIDKEREIVAILMGPRTRHKQSAEIVAEALEAAGITVEKIRHHKDLVDVKGGGWYTFVNYVRNVQHKDDVDLEAFWWEMYREEGTRSDMNQNGLEHLGDIAVRTERVVEALRRFVRLHRSRLPKTVDQVPKTLRVIAIASDINLEQMQQKGTPLEKRDQIWVKNGDVVEVSVWNDAETGAVDREEITLPFHQK